MVFLKNDRTQNIAFDVQGATITTDEHGNIYLHHNNELLAMVSGQEFVALTVIEVSDAG